jgi:hypothetical protein
VGWIRRLIFNLKPSFLNAPLLCVTPCSQCLKIFPSAECSFSDCIRTAILFSNSCLTTRTSAVICSNCETVSRRRRERPFDPSSHLLLLIVDIVRLFRPLFKLAQAISQMLELGYTRICIRDGHWRTIIFVQISTRRNSIILAHADTHS